MKKLLLVGGHRKVRFHVGTILLRLLIPYNAHHMFSRVGQAKLLDKFLFNSLPALMRTPKMLLGYTSYEHIRKEVAWLKPFGDA